MPGRGPNPGAKLRARAELLADPSRSDTEIAQAAECGWSTVADARRQLRRKDRPPPAERARPAQVPAAPGRPTSASAGAPRTRARTGGRARTQPSAKRQSTCAGRALSWPGAGSGRCHCPGTTGAVYAGLSGSQRLCLRAEARAFKRAAADARRDAQRKYGCNFERLHRRLGKAPTTAERYAEDPEMFKRQAGAYYQAHREEILARRKPSEPSVGQPQPRSLILVYTARRPGVHHFSAQGPATIPEPWQLSGQELLPLPEQLPEGVLQDDGITASCR